MRRRLARQAPYLLLIFAILSQSVRMRNVIRSMSQYCSRNYTFDGTSTTAITSSKSIAFLFMTSRGLNEDLWQRWFPSQNDSRYSIFVHTVPSNTTVPLGPFFCPYAIPSVPVRWYELHDGMMQVLQHAYDQDRHAQQFVFVSESSIPLVSFDETYRRLLGDDGGGGETSRFCWHPRAKAVWEIPAARLHLNLSQTRKAEMWSSLSRTHASIVLNHRTTLDEWNRVFLDARQQLKINRTRNGDKRTIGAPDECLLSTFLNHHVDESEFESCDAGMSHCCTTKVVWQAGRHSRPVIVDNSTLLGDRCYPEGDFQGHPCEFLSLRESGLRYLGKMGFLFLRKVPKHAIIKDSNGTAYKLNDVLSYVHQDRPLSEIPREDLVGTVRSSTSSSSFSSVVPPSFQCPAPLLRSHLIL